MRRLGRLLLALVIALALGGTAEAQLVDCTVDADNLPFGAIDPLDPAATDVTGNIEVTCSLLGFVALFVAYDISLSPGLSGDDTDREMASGANRLNYNLYRNAGRTQIWGDTAAGDGVSDNYLLALAPVTRDYPVYGRVFGSQTTTVPAAYADVIQVSVDF